MNKFGSKYAARLRSKHQGFGDTIFIDEVFIELDGKQYYLWRAVDQGGEVIHDTSQYAKNGAELSHQPTRVREREMSSILRVQKS